jgi:hypothetical protein
MIMTTPWGFQMTAARLVSLVIAGPDGPIRVDIAVQSHPLDAEDPMRPGDVMLWADDSDDDSADPGAQHRIADVLEAAATALRDARR